MSTFEFQGHSFQMESDAKLFLEKYLKRIDQYVKKNNIDADIVDDIHQNILEKLFELKEPIKQKKLISIINNLGEPEDIFEGNEEIDLPQTKKETKKGWILGICARLTEKSNFPVRIFRILFFAAIFFFTTGIRIYLLLFIIKYAVEGKEKTESEIAPRVKRFFSGLWRCIAGICKLIRNIVVRSCKLIKNIVIRGRNFIKAFFTKYLRKIISRCIRIIFILGLFAIILGLCFVLIVRFGDLTIMNQSFRMLFDDNISISLMMLLGISIFWLIALFSSFSKKPINNRYVHFIVAGLAVAGGIWLAADCTHFVNYQRIRITKEVPFVTENSDEIINFQKILPNNIEQYIDIHIADEFRIEASLHSIVFSEKDQNIISGAFISPNIKKLPGNISTEKNNQYSIQRENNQIFSHKVPFNALNISLTIYAPKNAKIKFEDGQCGGSFYRYVEGNERFVCDKQIEQNQKITSLETQLLQEYQNTIQQAINEFGNKKYLSPTEIEEEITRTIHNCIINNQNQDKNQIYTICTQQIEDVLHPREIEKEIIENNQETIQTIITNLGDMDTKQRLQQEEHIAAEIRNCIRDNHDYKDEIIYTICEEDLLSSIKNLTTNPIDVGDYDPSVNYERAVITECNEYGECIKYYE